jgi:hypothetical protein
MKKEAQRRKIMTRKASDNKYLHKDFHVSMNILLKYIYKKEEWPVKMNCEENFLEIEQDACPGIAQIKAKDDTPCPYYSETYNTVYKTLCKDTPFEYELEYFHEETGACRQVFRKKAKS